MTGYFGGYLGECVALNLGRFLRSFVQDPVMPSQEPPSDAKSEEVDIPPDDKEDTDGSKTLKYLFVCKWRFALSSRRLFADRECRLLQTRMC